MMWKSFFRRHGWAYALGGVLLVLCVYVQTQMPIALGQAIDALDTPQIDVAFVRECALRIVCIAIIAFILRFSWRYLIIGGSRHMERSLREALCQKLQSMPVAFFQRQRSGDLMAYAVNDISAVRMAFGPGLAHLLTGISTALFSLLSMTGLIHTGLTFAALAPVPLAVIAILFIGRLVRERFRRVQTQFAVLSGYVNENIMGMRVIKTFVQEDAQEARYDVQNEEMQRLNIHLARASAAMSPVTQALFGICFAISIVYGGSLVQQGVITLGNFATFNAYLLMIMNPVVAMGRIVNMLQRGRASLRRLEEILHEPGIDPKEMLPDAAVDPAHIHVQGLTFRYPNATRDALVDISFSLAPGRTLGIVGPTGSGKSTLLNLLMKFYPTGRDMLFVSGADICDVSAYSIRERTGYVPQEGFLFSGTLAENISFYTPGADEAAIVAAAREAGLAAELSSLPNGLQTRVGERGAHISGGQRQRTALARALIRKPSLLLLDDTLSAVDNRTQQAILASLEATRDSRGTIIISHKLSAVEKADEILYLEQGRVVERGDHATLLAKGGAYAALWAQQYSDREGVTP